MTPENAVYKLIELYNKKRFSEALQHIFKPIYPAKNSWKVCFVTREK